MNAFLSLPIVVLVITVSTQCVLMLLLLRPIGKKKKKSSSWWDNSLFLSSPSRRPMGSVLSVCLGSLGHRASSHIRKASPLFLAQYLRLWILKRSTWKKEQNAVPSAVKQNDTSICFQKDWTVFDDPELSPLFSCVVVLGKKEMTPLEVEGWKVGECGGNGMGCECNENKSGHNHFLCALESSFSYCQYTTLNKNIGRQILICSL